MRNTVFRQGKENREPVRRPAGGLSREGPESQRISALQELADRSPGVQLLAQLQARMDRPARTSSAVVQRVKTIVLKGKKQDKDKDFTVEKAAKVAKNNLDEKYDDVLEDEIAKALSEYKGESTFDSMDDFLKLVKSLFPVPEARELRIRGGIRGQREGRGRAVRHRRNHGRGPDHAGGRKSRARELLHRTADGPGETDGSRRRKRAEEKRKGVSGRRRPPSPELLA